MYLLLLAVGDDAIGLAIIAIFYPNPELPVNPAWLVLTVMGMVMAWGLRRRRVNSYWPYLLIGGVLSWTGLHEAHLHPALALVFIVPFLPHHEEGHNHLFELEESGVSPLIRFEHEWKVIVDFGLFLFGLVNAGVAFSKFGPATWIVLAALIIGKCVGIFFFGWLGERLGFQFQKEWADVTLLLSEFSQEPASPSRCLWLGKRSSTQWCVTQRKWGQYSA